MRSISGGAVTVFVAGVVAILLIWLGVTAFAPGLKFEGQVWRIVFGLSGFILVVTILGDVLGRERLLGKPIVRQSERGELKIYPTAVVALVSSIIQREFGLRRPKVEIRDESDSLRIHLSINIPAEEDIPSVTERIRQRIISEVEKRVGLTISSVDITVHGIAERKPTSSPKTESEPRAEPKPGPEPKPEPTAPSAEGPRSEGEEAESEAGS